MSQPDAERRERGAERAADTCRNGVPGCVGPSGFDRDYRGRPARVCRACVAAATGRVGGSGE